VKSVVAATVAVAVSAASAATVVVVVIFFEGDLLNRELSKNTQGYKIVPLTNLP